jgi:hypothetical protein
MKKERSLVFVPAALALALVAGPALAIDVTFVALSVDHPSYEGPCPVTITFRGTVEVDDPGTVAVQWLRSDGATSAATPLAFPAAGNKTVTHTWTLGDYVPAFRPFTGWLKLRVTSSSVMKEGYAEFSVNCRKKVAKVDLVPAAHTPMDGGVSIHDTPSRSWPARGDSNSRPSA